MGIRQPKEDNAPEKGVVAKKLMMQFICPRCNRDLTWAYEYASVYCRVCDRWIKAAQMKRINPARIDPEKSQLLLF
ncbi:MAG: hypothetical protein P4N59_04625 [Negativicutes bacterium]|nr:hypothetical protein [Negativicutes bacterium]